MEFGVMKLLRNLLMIVEISIQFICIRFDTKDDVLLNFAKEIQY